MPGIAIRNWLVRLIGSEAIAAILGQPRAPQSPAMEISPSPSRADRALRLVPARPARRRPPRPARTRCATADAVWCAFVSTRPSSPACRATTAASPSSAPAWPTWTRRSRALSGGTRRAPDRAPRRRRRRDPAPGRRARRPGRLHPPRRRPGRARAGRPGARAPGRRRPRDAHVQGSRDLRAQRDPDRRAHALRRLHALQERLAEGACMRVRSCWATAAATWTAARWRPRQPALEGRRGRARAGRVRLRRSAATLLDDPGLRPGTQGGEALLDEFLDRIDDYDATRDFPATPGPEPPGRPPALRHAVAAPPGAPWRASASRAAAAARRPGCPS